ncbi:MAG: histidine kinase [Bacteroidetes bacterium]|nr:histidine kinase [Bacteroidota bacterium]
MGNEKSRSYSILLISAHLLFWIAIYFVPFIVNPRGPGHPHGVLDPRLIINQLLLIFLFYFNSQYLLRGFYRKYGVTLYIIGFTVCLVVVIGISALGHVPPGQGPPPADMPMPPGPPRDPPLLPASFILMAGLIGAISIIYRLIADRQEEERLRKEKETQNLQAELSFLRSQINPHFIFNALNGTLSLILKKSDKAADSLLKLSNLMRYMLYESDADKVLLNNEIEYVNDYIDLQTLRFGNTIKIVREFDTELPLGKQIEPMLIIPFIENAFKHGAVMVEQPEIRIRLSVIDETLLLLVDNKFNPGSKEVKDRNSGIGLVNVRRRLELLYPGRHELTIGASENWYKIVLKINLAV